MAYTRESEYSQNGSILEEENKNIIKGVNKVSSETKKIPRTYLKLLAFNNKITN